MSTKNIRGAMMGLAAMLVFAIGSAVTISACAVHPIATAQTTEQKAFAVYGTFTVYEELAAKLKSTPGTPQAVIVAMQKADNTAKPLMDATLDATITVAMISDDLAKGKTTQDKLDVAVANLNDWVAKVTPEVDNLVTAVKGAK